MSNTQNLNPCPLDRRVGRRSGKEWLLAFALSFRSWLLNIRRNTRSTAIAPLPSLLFALGFLYFRRNMRQATVIAHYLSGFGMQLQA